jgi:ligand-binding sensor domain-containing protein
VKCCGSTQLRHPLRVRCLLRLCLFSLVSATLGWCLDPHTSITQYGRELWTSEDGLPQNSVRSTAQTKEGYLWLGTQAGLARFDGVRFTVFDRFNTAALKSDHILALTAGRNGSLWIGTVSSLARWKRGQFISYVLPEFSGDLNVRAILEDRNGVIWAGTQNAGLLRVEKGRLARPTAGERLSNQFVRCLYEDSEGALWIGTDNGLTRWKEGTATTYTTRQGLPKNSIWALTGCAPDSVWIGTRLGGLSQLQNGKFRTYSVKDRLPNPIVLSLRKDKDGNLWIGTDGGGLSRLTDGKITTYGTKDRLASSIVRSIFEDPREIFG